MTRVVGWGTALGLVLGGVLTLDTGDPVAAQALHDHAVDVAGDDASAAIWVDVHREWSKLRPWQSGYRQAQTQTAGIEARRRRLLR